MFRPNAESIFNETILNIIHVVFFSMIITKLWKEFLSFGWVDFFHDALGAWYSIFFWNQSNSAKIWTNRVSLADVSVIQTDEWNYQPPFCDNLCFIVLDPRIPMIKRPRREKLSFLREAILSAKLSSFWVEKIFF